MWTANYCDCYAHYRYCCLKIKPEFVKFQSRMAPRKDKKSSAIGEVVTRQDFNALNNMIFVITYLMHFLCTIYVLLYSMALLILYKTLYLLIIWNVNLLFHANMKQFKYVFSPLLVKNAMKLLGSTPSTCTSVSTGSASSTALPGPSR